MIIHGIAPRRDIRDSYYLSGFWDVQAGLAFKDLQCFSIEGRKGRYFFNKLKLYLKYLHEIMEIFVKWLFS